MINDYQFGQIKINGQNYNHDIFIDIDGNIKFWQRRESHLVEANDIKEAIADGSKILIIGTGAFGVAKVSDKIHDLIQEKRIELIILPTSEAVKKYNQLKQKGQLVTAYLHLTC